MIGPGFGDAIAARFLKALVITGLILISAGASCGFATAWVISHANP